MRAQAVNEMENKASYPQAGSEQGECSAERELDAIGHEPSLLSHSRWFPELMGRHHQVRHIY